MCVVWLLSLSYPRNISFKLCHLWWIRSLFGFVLHTTQILLVWVAIAPISTPKTPHSATPLQYFLNSPVRVRHGSWMHLVCGPVAVSGQRCLLVHCLCFLQPHWSHCVCWVLMLFLFWLPSHQSLPGTRLSMPKTQECTHCARALGVCNEVKTVPPGPYFISYSGALLEACGDERKWLVRFVFCFFPLADVSSSPKT